MSKQIGLDIESIGTDLIGGLVWSVQILLPNRKLRIMHDCNGMYTVPNDVADMLEDERIEKIIHNAAFDVPYIFFNLRRTNGKQIYVKGFIWDTDLAEQVIQSISLDRKYAEDDPFYLAHGTRLDFVLPRYRLGKKTKSLVYEFIDRPKGVPFSKQLIQYMEQDIKVLDKLRYMQEKVLERDELMEVALLEMEFLSNIVIPNKIRGVGFDSDYWMKDAKADEKEYNKRVAKLPKTVENWNSEKQIKAYFKKKGIFIDSLKNLDKIYVATRDPELKQLMDTREFAVSMQKYGEGWAEYVYPDGRLRPRIRQMVDTGRNSYSNPPLHGLPKRGKKRQAIVPAPGNVFVGADFGQQELGIAAAAGKEKIWIDAMLRGDDIHALTAMIIDKDKWDRVETKKCTFPKKCKCPIHVKDREAAKTSNFGLLYGGGPAVLQRKTGMEWFDAKVFVVKHKKAIPNVVAKMQKDAALAVANGEAYSADPYRRRRILYGSEKWHIENQGKNSPIQMAGANMTKLAAISVPKKYYVVLIIHDEIWLEVPKAQAKEAAKVLKSVMEKSADYITGIKGLIKADPKIAMNIMKGD